MINNHTIIVSSVSKIPRSSEDIFDSGTIGNIAYSLSTSLFDEQQYNQYTNVLLENSGLDYVGAISMDGMYVPYTTYYEHTGILPRFERPTSPSGEISVYELNPFNPNDMFGSGNFNSNVWMSGGHNISVAMTASNYSTTESLDSGLHPTSNHFDSDYYSRKKVEIQNVRSIAHRTPSVWSGWGYDTNGSPVPANTGDPSLLHPEALWNTALWKTGPLDIRWDQSRGVWAASGGNVEIMKFRIDNPRVGIGSTSAGCNAVEVTVTDIGYNTTSVSVGDTGVSVFDEDLCYLNLPISLITGLKGTAQAFRNVYSESTPDECLSTGVVNAPHRWVITGLCCGEEIIDVG